MKHKIKIPHTEGAERMNTPVLEHGGGDRLQPYAFGLPNTMNDDDNMESDVEAVFHANAGVDEGISGQKPIDTLFENFSQDIVDHPRSTRKDVPIGGLMPNHEGVDNPAPVPVDLHNYPHRRY